MISTNAHRSSSWPPEVAELSPNIEPIRDRSSQRKLQLSQYLSHGNLVVIYLFNIYILALSGICRTLIKLVLIIIYGFHTIKAGSQKGDIVQKEIQDHLIIYSWIAFSKIGRLAPE
jgi:hypothetical protein